MKNSSAARPGAGSASLAPPAQISVAIEVQDRGQPRGVTQAATLTLRSVRREPTADGVEALELHTDNGIIAALLHGVKTDARGRAGVWVGGAGGGLDGPARGLYPAACDELQRVGIAGLRVDYRRANDLPSCVLDTMLAAAFLAAEGYERVALVGHSFGGAVVITAGALSGHVTAVVPLSTQTYGADLAADVSPRPLLLVHGTADEILPHACSELVYAAAREPKELKLLPGVRHGLDEARDAVLDLLVDWLRRNT
jgi:alpha/beta superfamily hydrolase